GPAAPAGRDHDRGGGAAGQLLYANLHRLEGIHRIWRLRRSPLSANRRTRLPALSDRYENLGTPSPNLLQSAGNGQWRISVRVIHHRDRAVSPAAVLFSANRTLTFAQPSRLPMRMIPGQCHSL